MHSSRKYNYSWLHDNHIYICYISKHFEYLKLRSLVSHQNFPNKKKKGNLAKARHARRELTKEILVHHFTKIPKILAGVGAGVRGRGRGVFFSSRRERRAILNETTHEESFLNQLVEARELRKRVPRRARYPPRARSPSRRRSLLSTTAWPNGAIRERRLVLNFVMGIGWNARGGIVRPVWNVRIYARYVHTTEARSHSLSATRCERCVLELRVACAGVRERCSRKNPIHRRRNEESERPKGHHRERVRRRRSEG